MLSVLHTTSTWEFKLDIQQQYLNSISDLEHKKHCNCSPLSDRKSHVWKCSLSYFRSKSFRVFYIFSFFHTSEILRAKTMRVIFTWVVKILLFSKKKTVCFLSTYLRPFRCSIFNLHSRIYIFVLLCLVLHNVLWSIVCQKIACWIVIPSIPGRFYPSSTATQNRERKKGQASLRFNCAFLLSNSVAVKWTAGGGAAHMCDAERWRQGCAPRARGCPTAMHVVALPAFEAL